MKKQFVNVQISNPSESEINIKFYNESDAADFRIWWNRSGSSSFKSWTERGDSFYNKKNETPRCKNCGRILNGKCCEGF